MIYLARRRLHGPRRYVLRRSLPAGPNWQCQDLVDLGADPGRALEFPGRTAVHLASWLTDRLHDLGVAGAELEVEEALWPFVPPALRRRLEGFRRHTYHRPPRRSPAAIEALHPFDRRRFFFLRSHQFEVPAPERGRFYGRLCDKSRDEIEQLLAAMEDELHVREKKSYVTAALDLARHFPDWMFARAYPQTIEPHRLDEAFLADLCAIAEDTAFWQGGAPGASPMDYLGRYVIMYFDNTFPRFDADSEFIRRFMGSRRRFAWPERTPPLDDAELQELFGESAATLRAMDREALGRLYRRRAKDLHPDTGGGHEEFVRLSTAYQRLRQDKKP